MSVRTTSSAALSAVPNSCSRSRVRVKRCGWKTRSRRRPVDRAAAITAHLKTAFGAGELRERGGDARERHLQLEPDRHRSERIEQVVPPGHGQRQLAKLHVCPADPLK